MGSSTHLLTTGASSSSPLSVAGSSANFKNMGFLCLVSVLLDAVMNMDCISESLYFYSIIGLPVFVLKNFYYTLILIHNFSNRNAKFRNIKDPVFRVWFLIFSLWR